MFTFLKKVDLTKNKILRKFEENLKDALILDENEKESLENVNMKNNDPDSSTNVEQVNYVTTRKTESSNQTNELNEKENVLQHVELPPSNQPPTDLFSNHNHSNSNNNDDEEEEEEEEESHTILFCSSEQEDCSRDDMKEVQWNELCNEFEKQIKEHITYKWTSDTYQHVIEILDKVKKNNQNQNKEKKKEKNSKDTDSLEKYKECTNELFTLIVNDIRTLITNVKIQKNHVEMITYVNEIKKKHLEEISMLKKNEKRLNDINERQTNQLLQLSYQMASCKNEEDKWNQNNVNHKVKVMESEIQKLKEEEQKLNELLQDKMTYMRNNFELKCNIKDLESLLHKKSMLYESLKKEVVQVKKKSQKHYEHKQMYIEELQIKEKIIKEMQDNEQKLRREIEELHIENKNKNEYINKMEENYRKKEEKKLSTEISSGSGLGSSLSEESIHNKIPKEEVERNPYIQEKKRIQSIENDDKEKEDDNNINNITEDARELKKKIKSYELLIQEYKSSSLKSKNNIETQLKEVKKLLANEIKKNEAIQKNYQSLMNHIHNTQQEEKQTIVLMNKNTNTNGNVKIDPIHDTKLNSLIDEINLLTKEVKKLKEEQVIVQEEIQKKNQIISYLIKKHALNEEHFRLDSEYTIFKNKLQYDEMRKIMEETLIENIRLRTDLITLAKSVEERKNSKK